MSEQAKWQAVEINLRPNGTGTVVVDGHDLSNRVYKVELVAEAGKPNEVVLYLRTVEVKVMGSAWVSHKMLMLDPDTATASPDEVSG